MTRATFSYTNHTLLPEALEVWPVPLMERLLPRHMQIIYLINALHLGYVRQEHPGDDELLTSVSMIDEQQGRRVRMSHLAFLGSHRVNGVSALHTGLMRQTVFRDLHNLFPDRIVNVTNGIAFRRWLHEANPRLTRLLVEAAGPEVLDNENALTRLRPLANDRGFQKRFAASRYVNKLALADLIRKELEIRVDPAALFDVHIKRIHEYKRQLLNILEADRAVQHDPGAADGRPDAPRQDLRRQGRGQLSPGEADHQADPRRRQGDQQRSDRSQRPEDRVPAELLRQPGGGYNPGVRRVGADLHRRNGGVRHRQHEVRAERRADDRHAGRCQHRDPGTRRQATTCSSSALPPTRSRRGGVREAIPSDLIAASPVLAEVLDSVEAGVFSPDEPDRYRGLVNSLRHHDHFLVCADFDDYYETQRRVGDLWRRQDDWWQAAILNTANVGWFSSDRSIREYADLVWNVPTHSGMR